MQEQESFTVRLYREFLGGKSISELSSELGIPEERIEWRLRAAALHWGSGPAANGVRKVVIRLVRRF
jgi:hypothetical protein